MPDKTVDLEKLLASLPPLVVPAVLLFLALVVVIQLSTRVRHFGPSNIELASLYAKLFASPFYKDWFWQSKVKPSMQLDKTLQFNLPFKADKENIKDYLRVCEVNTVAPGEIPPFLASSMFLYPTVCLLSQRKYLFPVLGAIHVANQFRFMEPLSSDEEYTGMLQVASTPNLSKKKGAEVTFPQLLLNAKGKEVWRSVTTVLVPCRNKYYDKAAAEAAKTNTTRLTMVEELQAQGLKPVLASEVEYVTKKDTGMTFAHVSKDFNPIHLYSWSAKIFGFRGGAIAHGMFIGAKALHEAMDVWAKAGGKYPMEMDVKFIKPVFLGSTVVYKIYKVQDKKAGGLSLAVVVTTKGKEDNVHLTASLKAYKE